MSINRSLLLVASSMVIMTGCTKISAGDAGETPPVYTVSMNEAFDVIWNSDGQYNSGSITVHVDRNIPIDELLKFCDNTGYNPAIPPSGYEWDVITEEQGNDSTGYVPLAVNDINGNKFMADSYVYPGACYYLNNGRYAVIVPKEAPYSIQIGNCTLQVSSDEKRYVAKTIADAALRKKADIYDIVRQVSGKGLDAKSINRLDKDVIAVLNAAADYENTEDMRSLSEIEVSDAREALSAYIACLAGAGTDLDTENVYSDLFNKNISEYIEKTEKEYGIIKSAIDKADKEAQKEKAVKEAEEAKDREADIEDADGSIKAEDSEEAEESKESKESEKDKKGKN
jgi:hypothetical protein